MDQTADKGSSNEVPQITLISKRGTPALMSKRKTGAYAIIHVAGGQIVNAGQIDFTFPVDYKGRFDSAPDLELASYAPVVQAFVLLLGAP